MARKRKLRPDRILILVLLFILIALLIVYGFKVLFSSSNDIENIEPNNEIVINEKTIELGDYVVYQKNENLGFGFVVANINLNNGDSVSYDLANLVTDEGIKLSETYNYEKKLKTSNYDFNSLNTVNEVIEQSNGKVFIPFIDKNDSLSIIDSKSNYSILIDLTKNNKDIETLKKEIEENEIVSEDYSFSCQKPYIEDMMYHNGESYDSSMLSIYVYRLTVESITNGIKVTSASFTDKQGNVYKAYDETYSSSKIDNIIGKSLNNGDTYALFFELYSNQEDKIAYEGIINLEFSDGSEAKVSTTMN